MAGLLACSKWWKVVRVNVRGYLGKGGYLTISLDLCTSCSQRLNEWTKTLDIKIGTTSSLEVSTTLQIDEPWTLEQERSARIAWDTNTPYSKLTPQCIAIQRDTRRCAKFRGHKGDHVVPQDNQGWKEVKSSIDD